eukprot:11375799-Alexandrium_andersonii.AAC.1
MLSRAVSHVAHTLPLQRRNPDVVVSRRLRCKPREAEKGIGSCSTDWAHEHNPDGHQYEYQPCEQ